MSRHIFTGFGFGPIQSGLFVKEAYDSGNFSRIVVAEIDQALVDAVRKNNGCYYVNVAGSDEVRVEKIEGVELYNPNVEQDLAGLKDALAESTEIATSLPSVRFYETGQNSIASLLAEAINSGKAEHKLIYTAENNNHAAEILEEAVKNTRCMFDPAKVQFVNTVIGKMSQVVTDPELIEAKGLVRIAEGIDRAFLVEQFNHILATKCRLEGFAPGIEVFVEKQDLLPFEEAKLYGHNAIHALIAYLSALRGYDKMTEAGGDEAIMSIARRAFIDESGAALIHKYGTEVDGLFTEPGYKAFAEDLLERMTNPYLDDAVDRAGRDPVRKLGCSDRIYGTMRVCLSQGVEPVNMAAGAAAGIAALIKGADNDSPVADFAGRDWKSLGPDDIKTVLLKIWGAENEAKAADLEKLAKLTYEAIGRLVKEF